MPKRKQARNGMSGDRKPMMSQGMMMNRSDMMMDKPEMMKGKDGAKRKAMKNYLMGKM